MTVTIRIRQQPTEPREAREELTLEPVEMAAEQELAEVTAAVALGALAVVTAARAQEVTAARAQEATAARVLVATVEAMAVTAARVPAVTVGVVTVATAEVATAGVVKGMAAAVTGIQLLAPVVTTNPREVFVLSVRHCSSSAPRATRRGIGYLLNAADPEMYCLEET
jgi:hypothetical protein